MRKRIIICLAAICISTASIAQKHYATGLLMDNGSYDLQERKPTYATKGIEDMILPKSHSLWQYCPVPKSQGQHGTCVSWATAYAARTIAEAIKFGWTDSCKITQEAFSPIFLYALIKDASDTECDDGTTIWSALNLMKTRGVPKLSEFSELCADAQDISPDLKQKAKPYIIENYLTLFFKNCERNTKLRMVKKSLAENKPVIIAMWLPPTFDTSKEVLDMTGVDPIFPIKDSAHDYHALCVVGYDDNRYGGAFQIMNSWGTDWGNKGFLWVRYDDFDRCVDQGYEIEVKPAPNPKPTPKQNMISGSMEIVLTRDASAKTNPFSTLEAKLKTASNQYALYRPMHEGDQIRIYVTNNDPVFVYILTSDEKKTDELIFPLEKDHVTAKLGKSYSIALPSSNETIMMDSTTGKDYFCFLYSSEELDIQEIMNKMKSASGSFYERVKKAVGDKLAPFEDIRFTLNRVEFNAMTDKTVVPVIIEANHQ